MNKFKYYSNLINKVIDKDPNSLGTIIRKFTYNRQNNPDLLSAFDSLIDQKKLKLLDYLNNCNENNLSYELIENYKSIVNRKDFFKNNMISLGLAGLFGATLCLDHETNNLNFTSLSTAIGIGNIYHFFKYYFFSKLPCESDSNKEIIINKNKLHDYLLKI